MPRVGFEPTFPVLERAKTFHALYRAYILRLVRAFLALISYLENGERYIIFKLRLKFGTLKVTRITFFSVEKRLDLVRVIITDSTDFYSINPTHS
jgi:hypothetical protein